MTATFRRARLSIARILGSDEFPGPPRAPGRRRGIGTARLKLDGQVEVYILFLWDIPPLIDYLVFSIYLLIYLLVLIYDLFIYLIYILLEGPGEGSQS